MKINRNPLCNVRLVRWGEVKLKKPLKLRINLDTLFDMELGPAGTEYKVKRVGSSIGFTIGRVRSFIQDTKEINQTKLEQY